MSTVRYISNDNIHTISGPNTINQQNDSPGASSDNPHKFTIKKDKDILPGRDNTGHADEYYGKIIKDDNNLGIGQNPTQGRELSDKELKQLNTKKYNQLDESINNITRTQWKRIKNRIRTSNKPEDIAPNIIDRLNATVQLPPVNDTVERGITEYSKYYNRFKIANPDYLLQKGFAHVFFVRPSCNILTEKGELVDSVKSSPLFVYAMKNRPELVRELSADGGKKNNDFMMTLSNYAVSFSNNSEYIENEVYGTTYTGYKIAYGKHNIESKSAGEFEITFEDDRNLDIYQIDRMWVEYISGVYRGLFSPTRENIFNKVLDYTSAVYYLITAEDGETIIFWTKYYGVFPTSVPTEQYSWAASHVIQGDDLKLSINFKYSFKKDYDPIIIEEFNKNAGIAGKKNLMYMPTFNKDLNHVGPTMVGAPFISEESSVDTGLYYKLRFLEPDKITR